ncbi:hypothetical protein WJX72_007209 [[Myrmecia] bisecta]|uniref:Uncharacterized protein n=1 Tax=[Myrmecia] bisecta TaxID=41462 RepID=A0AAW1Q9E8_9CHLO
MTAPACPSRVLLALALCIALPAVLQHAAASTVSGTEEVDLSIAEKQYEKAMELRDSGIASTKDLKHAAALLKAAAGVRVSSPVQVPLQLNNLTYDSQEGLHLPGLEIAGAGHLDALKELALVYQQGDGLPQNPSLAHLLMKTAADRGHPEAQSEMGFRYALGLLPPTSGRSSDLFTFGEARLPEGLLNYYFSASSNDTFAQLALGYRHKHGLGVPKSCQAAVLYYNPVAEQVVELARRPGTIPQVDRVHGRLSMKNVADHRPSREQEALHYQWFADLGNIDAQRMAGQIFSHGDMRDHEQALRYFRQAAASGDADAMAHLGHMYANGQGVTQSNETALEWFKQGAEKNHPSALYGLGYMHLSGYGLAKDHRKAFKYFSAAAEQGHTESWFHLGVMHLNGWGVKPNQAQALYYFSLAAKVGHLLAMYNLAMMHLSATGMEKASCTTALDLLKKVAERGPWAAEIQDGYELFMEGDYESALHLYLRSAEMGMELAQSNAAWMLTHGYGYSGPRAAEVAIQLHKRAAEQGNVDALLSIGDSYYYGKGVARAWGHAAQLYAEAAKYRNAQALFNLGFMHEFGAGLPRDLHLAKRFYDKALEAQPDAVVPVRVALVLLRLHGWWDGLRPYLPSQLDGLWDQVFAVSDAKQGIADELPSQASHSMDWMNRMADDFSEWAEGEWDGVWGSLSEVAETAILLLLCIVLYMVLRKRQQLRTAQAAIAAPPPPHNGVAHNQAPAPAAAQPAGVAEQKHDAAFV